MHCTDGVTAGVVMRSCQVCMLASRCLRVTDAGYESIARHCRQLQELRMYACSGITDRTLAALGAHLALRVVDICGANAVTGRLPGGAFCILLSTITILP